MSAVIFQGTTVKALKNIFVSGPNATDVRYANLSADPTTTATLGAAGSFGFYSGTIYQKMDAGTTTAWKIVNKLPGVLYYDDASWGLSSSWTTGKNTTTFLSGGSIGGTHSRSTTAADLNEGTAVYKYVANATPANSIGDYMAQAAWTIPQGRRGVQNYTAGSYAWSGTSNEAYLVIYDATTSATVAEWALEPTGGQFREFSFPWFVVSSSSSLRYGFWIKSLATGSSTLRWSPITHSTGTGASFLSDVNNMSPWESYTPTGLWTTNATYTGKWRRVGEQMEAEVKVALSGAPTVAGPLSINIPSGYTIDTTKLIDSSTFHVYLGLGTVYDAGVNTYQSYVRYNTTTSVVIGISNVSGTWALNGSGVTQTQPITFGSGDEVSARFSVPIVGWAASVESVITPSKVMDPVIYRTDAGQSIPSGSVTIVDFEDKIQDPESHVSTGASWRFTAKRPGNYLVTTMIGYNAASFSVSHVIELYIYKNGSGYLYRQDRITATATQTPSIDLSGVIPMNAGDYIDVRTSQDAGGARTLQASGARNVINITALNSYPSIAQPVSRVARLTHYATSGNSGGTATSTVNNFQIGTAANFAWSGDTSFIREDTGTNSFYMPTGRYRIRKNEHAFYRVDNCSAHVYSSTTGLRYAKTIVMESSSVSGGTVICTGGYEEFSISSESNFNWRYSIDTTKATDGLGNPNGDGTNEHFGTLLIEKLV